ASSLRIDVYDPNGKWLDSRDIGRPGVGDWPASFGLYSEDEDNDRLLLVRLRAYPEGRLRDYNGERFADRGTFTPPKIKESVKDLCASPPTLALTSSIWVRRGRKPFIGSLSGGDCTGLATVVGSAAVAVDIPKQGSYRFGVLLTDPPGPAKV